MSKKLIDRPTEIRDDEKLNNSKLFEYLSEIIDLDIESFEIKRMNLDTGSARIKIYSKD